MTKQMRCCRTLTAGFTLLELLLVLAILAMAAALVAPRLVGSDQRAFEARLRQIHAGIEAARRQAIIDGRPVVLEVAALGLGRSSGPPEILFYPEGGSSGGDFCLRQDGRVALIRIDPLNGRALIDVTTP